MASLILVVSRLTGRWCSIGRRLGLKGKSPSWAYSSSFRLHRFRLQTQKSRCMQRPVPTESRDSVEPHAAAAEEVRNGSAPAFQALRVASRARKFASDSSD